MLQQSKAQVTWSLALEKIEMLCIGENEGRNSLFNEHCASAVLTFVNLALALSLKT
jgi:hypothetical protein